MTTRAFLGADTDALRALAAQMNSAAERFQEMSRTTGRAVQQVYWHGRDAQQFRTDWADHYAPALTSIAAALAAAGRSLAVQARQQDITSDNTSDNSRGNSRGNSSTPTAGGARESGSAWGVWSTWSGRLSAVVASLPVFGSAMVWTDAPRIGPSWWKHAAGEWADAHLPAGGVGARFMVGVDAASVFSDAYHGTTAALHGDWLTSAQHAIPAALTTASYSPNPWVAFPAIAGNLGWQAGSAIYGTFDAEIQAGIDATVDGIDRFNASPVGIWMTDKVVGPTGDAAVGAWERLASAVTGAVTGGKGER